MSHPAKRKLSPEEYLANERQAKERSEYYRGETFLLAGASRQHNRISTNISSALDRQLADRDCDVYSSDMRVLVGRTGLYTYPDVVVTCGEERFADEEDEVLLNPRVIFEILSASTEAYDRGRKFQHYQRIESLAEYVLVAQDAIRVERFVEQGSDWLYTDVRGDDGMLELTSISCELRLVDIYRRVRLPGPTRLR